MKYQWKVDPPPVGQYKSFSRRGWPTAEYEDGQPAAWMTCEDEYRPACVVVGNHKPITVYIADYSQPDGNCPWKRRRLRDTFATVHGAKEAFAMLMKSRPETQPKEKK